MMAISNCINPTLLLPLPFLLLHQDPFERADSVAGHDLGNSIRSRAINGETELSVERKDGHHSSNQFNLTLFHHTIFAPDHISVSRCSSDEHYRRHPRRTRFYQSAAEVSLPGIVCGVEAASTECPARCDCTVLLSLRLSSP